MFCNTIFMTDFYGLNYVFKSCVFIVNYTINSETYSKSIVLTDVKFNK